MPEEIDQHLALTLNQLELTIKQARRQEQMKCAAIEENPFYEPYKCTDLYLWKKETDLNQIKTMTFKKKNILRKPILHRLQSQTMSKGRKWLQFCKTEMENEITWVNFKDMKTGKSRQTYSMYDLKHECDKIAYGIGGFSFDDLFIPRRMSEMAETMYS